MNNRPKVPPVNINDLNKEGAQKEEHKPGPLRYVENKTSAGAPKSKLNLTQLVLAVGLSLVLFFVIAQFTLTSKGDAMTLLENQRLLESRIGGAETDLNTESGRIDNIINAQAGYATRSELAGLATTSALDTLRDLVTGYGSSITSLGSRIGTLEGKVAALESHNTTVVGGGFYCFLTKTTNGFVLTAASSRTGYFLAEVTLVLDDPAILYDPVGEDRNFIENMGYVDNEWKTVSITFYTGEFKLNAGEEKDDLELPLDLSGEVEDIGYIAYVEILPSEVTTTGGGNVI